MKKDMKFGLKQLLKILILELKNSISLVLKQMTQLKSKIAQQLAVHMQLVASKIFLFKNKFKYFKHFLILFI